MTSWTINNSIEFDNVAFMHYYVSAGMDQNQKYTVTVIIYLALFKSLDLIKFSNCRLYFNIKLFLNGDTIHHQLHVSKETFYETNEEYLMLD